MEDSKNERGRYTTIKQYMISVMSIRSTALHATFWVVLATGVFAQGQFNYSANAEKKFSDAVALFKDERYPEALRMFHALIEQNSIHQRTTAAYLMAAKTQFRLKEYGESVTLLRSLLTSFPETEYLDDVHYSLGVDYLMLQRYREAAVEFIQTLESTRNDKITVNARSFLETIVGARLDAHAVEPLLSMSRQQETEDFLILTLAEKFFEERKTVKAQQYLDVFLRQKRLSKYERRARLLQERLSMGTNIKIGVMLPLMQKTASGEVKTLAEEMLEGIIYAVNEHKTSAEPNAQVTLEVRDTNRDSVLSQNIVRELANQQDVIAIVGPIFSNIASVCAPVANAERIPMISPTASGNKIAAIGSYIFQASPDVETRGKAMARYAVQELGYTTLAVLAPDDQMTNMLTESFSREAQRLGARIVASETYNRDSSDLHEQFMNIRKAGSTEEPQISFAARIPRTELAKMLHAGADPHLVDSLRVRDGSVSVTKLFGPRGRRIADSLHLKMIFPTTDVDDIEIPVLTIQGIFTPVADADKIGIISSQMKYFNIQAQLLGNSEWYDLAQLEAHRRDTNGSIFISDFYVDKNDSLYNWFAKMYTRETKKLPTKYVLIGYDTMKLLLSNTNKGTINRGQMTSALEKVQDFKGIHSTISFIHGRVNSHLHILRYLNGEVNKIGEISVN